eukprot:8992260-Pyramimonas_sp.AAC.1
MLPVGLEVGRGVKVDPGDLILVPLLVLLLFVHVDLCASAMGFGPSTVIPMPRGASAQMNGCLPLANATFAHQWNFAILTDGRLGSSEATLRRTYP